MNGIRHEYGGILPIFINYYRGTMKYADYLRRMATQQLGRSDLKLR